MAIYYLKISGSDSNDGLTSSTAWRTFNKLLGTTGLSSGDTCYVGAGIYREVVTVNMTSATTETSIIGDVDGAQTGDAGEIQWTAYTINDETLPSTTSLLTLNGRDFLTFKNISFLGTGNAIILATTTSSINIKFLNCSFVYLGTSIGINLTIGFGVEANWIFNSCIFISVSSTMINISLTTGTGSDYNANILISNCLSLGCGSIVITSSGTSAQEGGGVNILNCSFLACLTGIQTTTTRVGGSSFTFPVNVKNCIFFGRNGSIILNSSELGNLIENNNIIYTSTPRTNTLIGPNSVSDNSIAPLLELGQSFLYNFKPKPFGMPLKNSPLLGFGDQTIAPLNDMLGNKRPKGEVSLLFQGTVTSATNKTLSDGSKNFGTSNNLNGYVVKILDGQGKGQTKTINGNTNTAITGDGLWITQPDTTSKYAIFQGPTSSTSLASSGSTITLQDNQAIWGTNFWQGHTMMVTSGTASGQNFMVSGNSATILTGYYPLSIVPASGDAYELFWGGMLKGTVSTGLSYEITDNLANWTQGNQTTGFWINGWRCMITEGTAAGSNFAISGNSPTTLSGWNSLTTIPVSGDKYMIYQNTGVLSGYYSSGDFPKYGRDFIQTAVGYYSLTNTAIKETGTLLSGANSIKLFGPGIQEFQIPVSGASTINVWGYFDDYYSGKKPEMVIKNGSGIGIADNTGIMVGNSGSWEKISLSFTGSKVGVLTLELRNSSTGVGGSSYFDALSIV